MCGNVATKNEDLQRAGNCLCRSEETAWRASRFGWLQLRARQPRRSPTYFALGGIPAQTRNEVRRWFLRLMISPSNCPCRVQIFHSTTLASGSIIGSWEINCHHLCLLPLGDFRYHVCQQPKQSSWHANAGDQYPENRWLSKRLTEAAESLKSLTEPRIVIVTRHVLGPSITDEEIAASLNCVPSWLERFRDVVTPA
jgi:hypothetical protein